MSVHPDFECRFCSRRAMPGSTDCADHQGCVPVARVDPRDAEIADLRRRLEVAERERDSEAGRDYWCDTCARASQSNEAGTCLVCGDDLVHVSEIPTLRAEAAEKRAEEAERECAEAWDVQGMAVARAEKAEAKLAEAEWERDAAIARAEAAEKRDATRIEGIMAQIADLERDRDHWRTVAESRPDISREDAARYIAWRSGFAPHPRNFDRLQPIDDALREHAQKAVTR